MLVNNAFLDCFPSSESRHLIRDVLDHAPIHLECNSDMGEIRKHFRFQNFWTKHQLFK